MSTSKIPGLYPILVNESAKLTVTEVLPTPPFPLYTPILVLMGSSAFANCFLCSNWLLSCWIFDLA